MMVKTNSRISMSIAMRISIAIAVMLLKCEDQRRRKP